MNKNKDRYIHTQMLKQNNEQMNKQTQDINAEWRETGTQEQYKKYREKIVK